MSATRTDVSPASIPASKRRMTVALEVLVPSQGWSPDDVKDAFRRYRPYCIDIRSVNVSAPAEET